MAPTDRTPGGPRKPRPRRATDPIREAAADGRAEWVNPAPAESWDPWEEPPEPQQPLPDPWGEAGPGDRGLDRTLGEWLEAVVPPEAQLHFYNAGREFAAGIQATVEHHMKGAAGGPEDDGTQPVRIEIE